MTEERALQTELVGGSLWKRFVANHRLSAPGPVRDIILPISAFLGPLLVIVLIQCYSFGCGLLLGWDSSTYAWWAVLFQEKGALTMVLNWHYPHLYVLILSGFGSAIGSVSTAEHILPLLVSLPLGYAYYALTMRLTSDRRLALFACFIGGVSIATIEMVSDIQRNLLAFGIALPLGASIYLNVFSGATNPKRLWKTTLVVWLPLLLVILSTQVETYVVLSITLLLAAASSRKRSLVVRGVALVTVPVLIASPLMIGYFSRYGAETAKLIPLGPDVVFQWIWLYLSGFAIPLLGVGIFSLTQIARNRNPIARYLLLWLVGLVILVPPALVINVPPTRLLFFIPLPILLALAVPHLGHWIARSWRALRAGMAKIRPPQPAGWADPSSGQSFSEWARSTLSLVVAFLIVAAPVVATTAANKDQLRPFVTEAEVERLWNAAGFVRQSGYGDAILVVYEGRAALFAPLFRAYFGMRIPDNLAYYGKLQFLFSLPAPALAYTWKYDERTEGSYSTTFRDEILSTIGVSAILSRTIVVAGGTTYAAAPSEVFLSRFERTPGIYVIPPGALSALDVDTWRLFAASDCYVCAQGKSVPANWSQSPAGLEYVGLSMTAAFESTYTFSLARQWGNGNLTIGFWDWPAEVRPSSGPNVTLAPLDVYLDGMLVLDHHYADLGAFNITVPTGSLTSGIHRLRVTSTSPGLGVAVRLDDFKIVPSA